MACRVGNDLLNYAASGTGCLLESIDRLERNWTANNPVVTFLEMALAMRLNDQGQAV